MKLMDTHAHLEAIQDLQGALIRAKNQGIRRIIGVGSDLASNRKILALAARHPDFILPALGLHPWRLDRENIEGALAFISENLSGSLALGEVGLDFAIPIPKETQEEVLLKLLAIASRENKPVLLHARRAWPETLELLEKIGIEKAIFHWYSGPLDVLKRILERGYFLSATPAARYSDRHRQALKEAPLNRILLETDAPEEYRGILSEPKDLVLSLQALSELKGKRVEEVAARVWENSLGFFGIEETKGSGGPATRLPGISEERAQADFKKRAAKGEISVESPALWE